MERDARGKSARVFLTRGRARSGSDLDEIRRGLSSKSTRVRANEVAVACSS